MSQLVIDFHAHVLPIKMAKKSLPEVSKRARIEYFNDGTVKGLLNSMGIAGVDISVVSRITTNPKQIESVNEWMISIGRDNIIPMATWHPDLTVVYERILGLKDQGFKCLKLHPDYQGFYVDEIRMFPLYEAAQAAGMPILFHAGLDRGLPPPLHAPPEKLLIVHNNFSDLKMIAAHMGGEDNYEDTKRYLLGKEIYLDTSFVLRKMPMNILEDFMRKHSKERILFGSDSPWSDQAQELNYLFSLPFLSEDAKELIAGSNTAKLLDLS
jgi:predicted TIM-barrel fold metal-dependent hydrolase